MSVFVLLVLLLCTGNLWGDDLEVRADEVLVSPAPEGGFFLWIRRSPGLGSVMLTESSSDPRKQKDSYALRAPSYNTINGDERRLLDGKFVVGVTQPLYFLVDSSPEFSEEMGMEAFQIYIPPTVLYGYPWARQGKRQIKAGSWFNIRTFEKPYADYRGAFRDNPVTLSASLAAPSQALPGYRVISRVSSPKEALEKIRAALFPGPVESELDVVLVLDSTSSMRDDLQFLRSELPQLLKKILSHPYRKARVGMVLYRDYKEEYLTKIFPFESNLKALLTRLNKIKPSGGQDKEEAVEEGLYSALLEFNWKAPRRLIIQVGDAPSHRIPRGEITKEIVDKAASRRGVQIHSILLPAS